MRRIPHYSIAILLVYMQALAARDTPISRFDQDAMAVARMFRSVETKAACRELGLEVLSVTWEDTGRFRDASIGPNLSDVTVQVQVRDGLGLAQRIRTMPVIRLGGNLSDFSGEISPERVLMYVGNEVGEELTLTNLSDYLGNLRSYLTRPNKWKSDDDESPSLLKGRDSKVLLSAQAVMVPALREGLESLEINPAIFNYQSFESNPAVLAVVATSIGTSAAVIDNHRDRLEIGRVWGQRLFFNDDGSKMHYSLTPHATIELDDDILPDAMLIIQIPLVQDPDIERPRQTSDPRLRTLGAQPIDLSHTQVERGELEGDYEEIAASEADPIELRRDERFPIRVTAQFYLMVGEDGVTPIALAKVRNLLESVYRNLDNVGSLISDKSIDRITEPDTSSD